MSLVLLCLAADRIYCSRVDINLFYRNIFCSVMF